MTKVYYLNGLLKFKRQALDALDKILETQGDFKAALDRLGVSIMTARRLAFYLEDMDVFPETETQDIDDMTDPKRKACLLTFDRFSESYWQGLGDLMSNTEIDCLVDEISEPPADKVFSLHGDYSRPDIGSWLIDNMSSGFSLGMSPYTSRDVHISGRLIVEPDVWPYKGQDGLELMSYMDDSLMKRLLHNVCDLGINTCLAALYIANTSEAGLKNACDALDCLDLDDLTEELRNISHILECGKEILDRVYIASFSISDYETGELLNYYKGYKDSFEYKHIQDSLDLINWSRYF